MSVYANIDGAQKQLSALYANVGGAQKQLSSFLGNVDGASKELLAPPVALSTKAIGSIVKVVELGIPREFYVAKHGYVSGRSLLVRKNTYSDMAFNTNTNNDYVDGSLGYWLAWTYPSSLNVNADISAVNVPCYSFGGGIVASNSLKAFILSAAELNITLSGVAVEGTALTIASTLRIAHNDSGFAIAQWTRSISTVEGGSSSGSAVLINSTGTAGLYSPTTQSSQIGVRPCFTLASTIMVDSSGNIIP